MGAENETWKSGFIKRLDKGRVTFGKYTDTNTEACKCHPTSKIRDSSSDIRHQASGRGMVSFFPLLMLKMRVATQMMWKQVEACGH